MLSQKEIRDRLFEYAGVFRNHMANRRYEEARYCYDTALNVSTFICLDPKDQEELFGIRGERGEIVKQGAFPDSMVIWCYEKTKKH